MVLPSDGSPATILANASINSGQREARSRAICREESFVAPRGLPAKAEAGSRAPKVLDPPESDAMGKGRHPCPSRARNPKEESGVRIVVVDPILDFAIAPLDS